MREVVGSFEDGFVFFSFAVDQEVIGKDPGASTSSSSCTIHGLRRKAMNIMDKGHPCGMPSLCLWPSPSPEATALKMVWFSMNAV